MVNIAVPGGSGNVATELLREPIASGKHTITIFTRSGPPANAIASPHVFYKKVDYSSVPGLTEALRGFDVCLSFLVVMDDAGFQAEKNVIDACVAAGVKRYAPSEWGIKSHCGIPAYKNKDRIADYLQAINTPHPVLEYCLFQPSIWLDYLAHPHPLAPSQLHTWPFFIDLPNRRAFYLEDGTHPIVLTSTADTSTILSLALSDPRPWPRIGGIRGCRTTYAEIIEVAKKIRPGEWHVERVEKADLDNGVLRTSWVPIMQHPVIPEGKQEEFSRRVFVEFMGAMERGAWDVGGEWNERFPDVEFMGVEEYLRKTWEGRE